MVAGASTVTSYTDHRLAVPDVTGRLVKALSDANATLSFAEVRNQILEFTGVLTAQRNIVLPLKPRQYTVFANTTVFGLQFIGASGPGVAVAVGKRAIVYADGTNIVRAELTTSALIFAVRALPPWHSQRPPQTHEVAGQACRAP